MQKVAAVVGKRGVSPWITTALIALPSIAALIQVARVYVKMPLTRDPMIFQYTAWAVRHGELLYRDILDVNGPLITLMHMAFQALGGDQPERFRVIDLALHGAVFVFASATIVDAIGRDATARATVSTRTAWTVTTMVTLFAAYFTFDYWDSAQRDGLYFLWILTSASLQVRALERARPRGLLLAGVLSGVPWLGKPTFVAFSLVQAIALASSEPRWRGRIDTSVRWLLSCGLGALLMAIASLSIADVGAWFGLLLRDVTAVYRHLAFADAATQWRGFRGLCAGLGIVGALVQLWLVRTDRLPPRALAFGLLPLAAIANIAVQSKGYFYHFEPLWIGVALQWSLLLSSLHGRVLPLGLAVVLSGLVVISVRTSMYFPLGVVLDPRHPAAHDPNVLLRLMSHHDSRLLDEAMVGEFLASHTAPSDRVQVFGMDPSVLFLSQRRSATPYIYAFDLVVDHAVAGAQSSSASATQVEAIEAFGANRRADFAKRLRERPPAAIVFPASAVFLPGPPERLFRERMPELATWLDAHYHVEREIGSFRIYGSNASN